MNAKTAAIIIGLIFLAIGLLGFVPNPIVGDSANVIFHTDKVHNIVHIVSGALFLLVALTAPSSAGAYLKIFGVLYLVLGLYGLFTMGMDETKQLLGFLHVNKADNYLHIVLGILIFLAGTMKGKIPRAD